MSEKLLRAEVSHPGGERDLGVVLHQGAIGDFVLTLSLVEAVRSAWPVPQVMAVVSAAPARLAAGRSAVDSCGAPDTLGLHTLFHESASNDERLTALLGRASWVLSCLGDEDALPSRQLRRLRGGRCICIDPRPDAETLRERRHITTQWAEDIRRVGLGIADPGPARIEATLAVPGTSGSVVIHPGSGAREKCWPFERFLELADHFVDSRVLWLLGPAEMERFPGWHEILGVRPGRYANEQLIVEADITEVAEHIASAGLYIGNDAGLTHVAAALGVPTVAIYGPTDPCVWRPLSPGVRVVCCSSPGPIEGISVHDVVDAV